MKDNHTRKVCFSYLLSGLIVFFLLVLSPQKLWSQSTCAQSSSWISRWTISSITGPGQPNFMIDGDKNTFNDVLTAGAWTFNVDFGIMRRLSEIKIVGPNALYSPHAYQIFVSQDNVIFTLAKTGTLLYTNNEQIIDLNGFFNAQYVRIVINNSYTSANTFAANRLQISEINFIQCGVDPLIAKQVAPAVVVKPALSCADAVSKDIQGIINTYIPGLADALKGGTTITVDMTHVKGAAHTLVAGDRILIIQMQNAQISETNSMAYGDGVDNDLIASGWQDVRNTGEYEFSIVSSVSGNVIQLTQPLQKSYSANGVFQVVYSPVYDNVTLNGMITATPWDGYCGGIVTFDAKILNMNNQSIDVSSQGFRKGKMNSNSENILYFWGVYCTDNNLLFGEKGEGIAGAPRGSYTGNSKRFYSVENQASTLGGSNGRGAAGNAGGGGADHNSGGGGGANIGSGGQGGASYGYTSSGDMTLYWSVPSPNGGQPNGVGYYPNGGMGGTGSGAPDPFRIWMGGAGGGGHQNNNAATGGSNGGGIILATARTVKGTGYFYADGLNSDNTVMTGGLVGNDGAGGGGAGGTIVFGFTDQSSAVLSYSAKGGNGGSVMNEQPHGPAGGGGGGAVIISGPPSTGMMNIAGGRNGIHVATGSQWGANSGQDGKVLIVDNLSALYTYSCDHGDAPLSYLDAAHQIKPNSPSLNTPPDAETMALNQPPHDRDAKGDDLNGIDDEDGVQQPFDTTLSTAQSKYTVRVFVKNPSDTTIIVSGWIDFNGNGTFDDNEKISKTGILNGPVDLVWTNFPADITGGDSYARFRISTGTEALQSTGVAPDGEVEDYTIYINGMPAAVPDDTCTHQDRPVNILIVKNDNIHGDKKGKVTILIPPLKGVAVVNDNNTPNDKSDDFITYTPNPGFQGIDTLTYELWNSIGNSAKAKVTITVKNPISIDFKATPNEGCSPLSVAFSNLSSHPDAKYTWDFGDKSPPVIGYEPVHVFSTVDTVAVYNVKLQMNTGCGMLELTIKVTVHPIPRAVISEKSNDEKPEVVVFSDVSANVTRRTWTIDGLNVGTSQQVTGKFDSIGPHIITLRVFNDFGCSDDTVLLHTTMFRNLYVPNAFIPDSPDNLVNTFKPVGFGLKEYTLMIFDLWGNLIWSNSELKNSAPAIGWDGKDKNGKPLPSDTYIWRIKAVLEGNKPWKGMKMPNGSYHTEGPVTIIR